MASNTLTEAEVWDDSSLMKSWNEAFEEYKKYHSLAAKGEKVRLEKGKPVITQPNGGSSGAGVAPAAEIDDAEESPDGSEDYIVDEGATLGTQPTAAPTGIPSLPQMLAGTVQNEDLKNVMMSWYYAGYYTGLYDGKQQGYASAMEHQQQR